VTKNGIAQELERIEESTDHSAQTQFTSTKFWRGVHLTLGAAAAIGAGVAGTSALADLMGTTATGVAALAAAAMGAILTTLDPSQRAERAHVSANTYLALRDDARIMRSVDLSNMGDDEAKTQLQALSERRADANMAAPVPALFAYRLGSRNIRKGRTKHEVDKRS
jgi:hypothetical protein